MDRRILLRKADVSENWRKLHDKELQYNIDCGMVKE
jgi:hypothetical protein